MQPEERDAAYLWNMLDAARAIREFVSFPMIFKRFIPISHGEASLVNAMF